MKKLIETVAQIAQIMEEVYWEEVQQDRLPSVAYREALRRVRVRLYSLQKMQGLLE
jgi:hypothetical protein